jgi:GNAT superfamily N-acetyltransferase
MNIEIVHADSSAEAVALSELDQKIFNDADYFEPPDWRGYEAFWIMVDGQAAGSIAFDLNAAANPEEVVNPSPDCLFIVSIGLLPGFRGLGIGDFALRWELDYARVHGFTRLVATCRASNKPSIRLHNKWGFVQTREIPDYYEHPNEPAVVLELRL